MKIGIISASGGHLAQAMAVMEAFQDHTRFLAVQDFPNMKGLTVEGIPKIYFLKVYLRYKRWIGIVFTVFMNAFQLFRIFLKEKPDLLFSTGSEVAIPAFVVGKIFFRTKIVFLESITRLDSTSGTGKWVYPISDLFLVQTEKQLVRCGPKAKFYGSVL